MGADFTRNTPGRRQAIKIAALAALAALLIGFAGAWFCLQQAQKWNDVKKEDIPDIKQNLWKRKKK